MRDSQTVELNADDIPFGTNGLNAPTFYADYIRGTAVSSGVVKLNFVDNRLDAIKGEICTVHVATIIAPVVQIRAWATYLNQIADQQGIPPLQQEGKVDG